MLLCSIGKTTGATICTQTTEKLVTCRQFSRFVRECENISDCSNLHVSRRFGWDCIFGSYIASAGSRNVSYSALIQVIKSKTENGFVPNGATAGGKSQDRTEPMMGAKVLLEMYRKFDDLWLVQLLFDDLLDWNNWSMRERTMEPLDLIVPIPDTPVRCPFAVKFAPVTSRYSWSRYSEQAKVDSTSWMPCRVHAMSLV